MKSRCTFMVTFLLVLCTFTSYVSGLAQESFGNAPLSPSPDWPNGIETLIKSPGRLYSVWVNGNERFYYAGDAEAINTFLKSFGAIKIPIHIVVVDEEWPTVTQPEGQVARFDWMLSVPSGIYRAHIIKEKGTDANEQYPSIHLMANSDRINFSLLVIPKTMAMVWPKDRDTNKTHNGRDAIFIAYQWSKAMSLWTEYADSHIAQIRAEETDSARQWVEVTSELISKWLPNYRFFVFETFISGHPSTFALNKAGTIFEVGSGDWSGMDKKPMRNKELSKFLKQNYLKIVDANAAVSAAKLVEELSFTAQTVGGLRYSTKNFRLFDKRFYEGLFYKEREYQYSAEKKNGYWQILQKYIGPPNCCTMHQPDWRLVVDTNNVLVDVYY
jgi:hypothetical protein